MSGWADLPPSEASPSLTLGGPGRSAALEGRTPTGLVLPRKRPLPGSFSSEPPSLGVHSDPCSRQRLGVRVHGACPEPTGATQGFQQAQGSTML